MSGTRNVWRPHIHAVLRAMRSLSAILTAESSPPRRICLKRQNLGAIRRWCAFKSRWFLFLARRAPLRRYVLKSANTPSNPTSLATLLLPRFAAFHGPIFSRSLELLVLASLTPLASNKHPKWSECASANGRTSVKDSQLRTLVAESPQIFFRPASLADLSTLTFGFLPLTLNSAPIPRASRDLFVH